MGAGEGENGAAVTGRLLSVIVHLSLCCVCVHGVHMDNTIIIVILMIGECKV